MADLPKRNGAIYGVTDKPATSAVGPKRRSRNVNEVKYFDILKIFIYPKDTL
jgi:hypothetical protein